MSWAIATIPFGAEPSLLSGFAYDSFSDVDGQNLDAHISDSGHEWIHATTGTGELVVVNGRLYKPLQPGLAVSYINVAPPSAEYDVTADFVVASGGPALNDANGVLGRIDLAGTTDGTFYYGRYAASSSKWEIRKVVNGVQTSLGLSAVEPLTPGQSYRVTLEIRNAAKRLLVDGVQKVTTADNVITAAGFAGVRGTSGAAQTATLGIHLDNFRAA